MGGFEGLSSGVVIALAAVLWLVYLLPTWLRRREYLATERNAVRLQQTLRIMAETAEVPDQVRIEVSARSAATHEKILHREMQRTEAIARAQAAAAARAASRQLAEREPAIAASVAPTSRASRRLRRSRALATLVLVLALSASGFGIATVTAGGAPALLIAGAVVAFGCVALLAQIAQVAGARTQLAQTLQPRRAVEIYDAHPAARVAPVRASWTPVPIPKPLYLSRSEIVAQASVGDTSQLLAAAAESQRALRAAQDAAQPIKVAPVVAPASAPNRFASMGIIEVDDSVAPNLDDVLRRRRAI